MPPKPSARTAGERPAVIPLLALLMAMTALGPLTLNIIVPAIPGLVATLGADPATVQLTVSLYLLGLAVSQLALGPLSDRFGRRPVVMAGLLISLVSSIAAIAAGSIGALIVARTCQAFGASTGLVIGRAIIRDLFDRDKAASMIGWVATVMVVAPMISPLIGGLLDTAFGWEAIFVFVSLLTLTVLAWAWFALPETRPDHVTGGGIGYLAGEARALLSSAPFIGYVLAGALGSATFFAFLGGSAHVTIGIMGHSSAVYGVWFALSSIGYMAGNFFAANLSIRFGVDKMIKAGLICELIGAIGTVVSVLMFPLAGPASIFVPQALISFGNGLLLPNAIAGAVSVRPQAAGTASGITGFTQMAIGAVAAQVVSWLLTDASTAMPMSISMVVLATAAMIGYLALVREKAR